MFNYLFGRKRRVEQEAPQVQYEEVIPGVTEVTAYNESEFIQKLRDVGIARYGTINNWSEAIGYKPATLSSVFYQAARKKSFKGVVSSSAMDRLLRSVDAEAVYVFNKSTNY